MSTIPFPIPSPQIIADVIELYLSDLDLRVEMGQIKPKHAEHQKMFLLNFAALYGRACLSDAKQRDLAYWLSHNPGWKSTATVRHGIYAVLACFRWAEREEVIEHCPYRRPHSLNLTVEPRPPVEPKWYVAVMRAARKSKHFRRGLLFVRRTGCRLKEMRELCWQHVDFDAEVVRMPPALNKTDGGRIFGLEPAALRFLKNLRRRSAGELVFPNNRGGQWTKDSFGQRFRYWANKVRMPKDQKAYALRHGFTVAAIENGVEERQIADQLGHASTRMVSWYGKHTRRKTAHLRNVAAQAMRKRRPPA